jgi:hypothetical protein
MDGAIVGLIGGIVGTLGGGLGAFIGARASYKSAVNDAQRRFYRRIFVWLAPIGLVFVAIMWAVAAHVLPSWVYYLAMALWFGPLGPAIVWANRHLAALAAVPDVTA